MHVHCINGHCTDLSKKNTNLVEHFAFRTIVLLTQVISYSMCKILSLGRRDPCIHSTLSFELPHALNDDVSLPC